MKTPWFWRSINLVSLLLFPFSLVYWVVAQFNFSRYVPRKFATKILCVGNILAGGAGKTPVAIMLGQLLISKGFNVAYACKNYLGTISLPIKVNDSYKIGEIVDEAMLLAKTSDTFVAPNLIDAIAMADRGEYDYIITDDGLQNNQFYKDISILIVDGKVKFGNNFLLPAGPLRETFINAQDRVDFVAVVGDENSELIKDASKPMIFLQPEFGKTIKNKYVAFTGIAYPEKFYSSLEELKIDIVDKISYPDHFCYSVKDIEDLIKKSEKLGARLITTSKDLVKIAAIYHSNIDVLEMKLIPKNQLELEKLLNI
jgi:tetraacyldisaccharide 4'-kinase